MKILHVTASLQGGAGVAAGFSVRGLRDQGVDAEIMTAELFAKERSRGLYLSRRWRNRIDYLPLRLYFNRKLFTLWSNNWLHTGVADRINKWSPDIVHMHWIGSGFIGCKEIGHICPPVVWTLHDAWPITGGCHYPDTCRRFGDACGKCPQLGSHSKLDISRTNRYQKRGMIQRINAWVAPSVWMKHLALKNRGIAPDRICVVYNGMDILPSTQQQRIEMRVKMGISEKEWVLVAAAIDLAEPRKGCHILPEVISRIAAARPCRVLTIGKGDVSVNQGASIMVQNLGALSSEEVMNVLRAADLLLLPSYQDNLPNIALEAHACGVPVAAFDSGGISEIVIDRLTGVIARPTSPEALADAVLFWASSSSPIDVVRLRCRKQFESKFGLPMHSAGLIAVYESLLKNEKINSFF